MSCMTGTRKLLNRGGRETYRRLMGWVQHSREKSMAKHAVLTPSIVYLLGQDQRPTTRLSTYCLASQQYHLETPSIALFGGYFKGARGFFQARAGRR